MSHQTNQKHSPITIPKIIKAKEQNKKLSVVTCYDSAFGKILDKLPLDIVLVGDSLGNVVLGMENTIPVTLEHMIHHTKAVTRVVKTPLVVADMPFFSAAVSTKEGIKNAIRLIQEGNAAAVKIEGGKNATKIIKKLTKNGIPVMGHIGLTPQSIHTLGGYKVQGKSEESQKTLIDAAVSLEDAGAFSIVLEAIPENLGKEISEKLKIPTIGIGAGRYTDGQVLVLHDLLGFDTSFKPKYLKHYLNMDKIVSEAVGSYIEDVLTGNFPSEENRY